MFSLAGGQKPLGISPELGWLESAGQKEEEIGNLPDKEFRIMIVKLIQNLEIKMESQINSPETRIEMKERFNKTEPERNRKS